MKAICILLDVPPKIYKNKNSEKVYDYWKAAKGPEVLGDPNISEKLVDFDEK